MEAAGGCAELCARARPAARLQPQEVEPRAARRRLAQAQHRAVLAGLFSSLQETVLAQSDSPASKYQVLHKAKKYIQELEQTLSSLPKMKESFSLEDGNPSSLEEVREEYIKRYFSNQSTASPSEAVSESDSAVWYLMQECEKQTMEEDGKPGLIQYPETSSPDLVEFERYLYFYKNTVDLLREHGIVSAEEVPLPVVSTAISHLWQELSEERRDSILQYCSQRDFHLGPTNACQESACTGGDVRDSGGNSEEASGSLVSTPEEVMFEDAFDVAAGFLETNETQGLSSQSSSFTSGISENAEDDQRLYLQITDFLKSLFFANTQFCQEEDLQFDYETVMLRCTETFDDEDL
ncbi:stimulated by retinoic acid gene 8 protein homolog isoform X2 [Coturnix japonica]|uniref:stimulated by retinoic acid gene 8 protein homolog isoform X2 n=2 Tax=Coturnix japonica TaxID=93934 RepID=UPI0007777D36|nr:stimulated by retinoic acid gene 8 protein homolog isoform X2 [Coturnix japonica]